MTLQYDMLINLKSNYLKGLFFNMLQLMLQFK